MPRKPAYIGLTCGGCKRTQSFDAFVGTQVRPETPPEKIHQSGSDPRVPGGTYLCPCGHYTVYPDINRGDRVMR
jgi:hypothetical protein